MSKKAATTFFEVRVRVRGPLHTKLMAAKKRNGVSLADEVTKRLEASFEAQAMHNVFEEAKAGLDEVFGHMEKRARMLAEVNPALPSTPTEARVALGMAINTTIAQAVTTLAEVGYPARAEARALEAPATKKGAKHVTR
jgi:hypothetical protein